MQRRSLTAIVPFGARRAPLQLSEDLVRVLKCFFAADVEPTAFDLKSVDRFAGVKPLQEKPRLIGIVSSGEISRKEWQHFARVIIQRDRGQRAFRSVGLLLE